MNTKKGITIADEVLMNKIYRFREQRVMLDRDLAELYGVETKLLKQAVRRNRIDFQKILCSNWMKVNSSF